MVSRCVDSPLVDVNAHKTGQVAKRPGTEKGVFRLQITEVCLFNFSSSMQQIKAKAAMKYETESWWARVSGSARASGKHHQRLRDYSA